MTDEEYLRRAGWREEFRNTRMVRVLWRDPISRPCLFETPDALRIQRERDHLPVPLQPKHLDV